MTLLVGWLVGQSVSQLVDLLNARLGVLPLRLRTPGLCVLVRKVVKLASNYIRGCNQKFPG
jgi:hypothetical protein